MSGIKRANWNHAKIKGIGLPKLFGGSIKLPNTLTEWSNNAEKLLKENHIQTKTFDYLFGNEKGGLSLKQLVKLLKEMDHIKNNLQNNTELESELDETTIKNYITKSGPGDNKIKNLKVVLSQDSTLKKVYTDLQELKRFYRAIKAQEIATNKEASTITIKAMRAKWGIEKLQKNNSTYTDDQIKQYAEILQKNFQSISKIKKYGVTVFYNEFSGFKGNIDNPKDWIKKLVNNLDIQKKFFEGDGYKKEKKENPFYCIFFTEPNCKKTFDKIKSSNNKIQAQE